MEQLEFTAERGDNITTVGYLVQCDKIRNGTIRKIEQ